MGARFLGAQQCIWDCPVLTDRGPSGEDTGRGVSLTSFYTLLGRTCAIVLSETLIGTAELPTR